MDSTNSLQNSEVSSKDMNNHVQQPTEKQHNSKKLQPPKKVYIERNSFLTDLMEVNHIQSLYNIMVAVFYLLLLNAALYYLASPNVFWKDMEIMRWASSHGFLFIKVWLVCNLYAMGFLEGFKGWIHIRNQINSKVADSLFIILYLLAVVVMFTATSCVILRNTVPPITAFALSIEQVRLYMKIHSFLRESTPRVLQYKPTKDGEQLETLYPSRGHYFYYLCAPALIYRDTFPRVKDIRWEFVFRSLFQFFACIFIAYCAFMRFIVDVFRNTGLRQFSLQEAATIYACATFVGALMMFLIFYCVLHSWLNFAAEILRFGDREFYQDWWNSTNFAQYYRKWNLVVYDWLHAYIYMETHKLGFSKSASMVTVFLISALFHEYIIGLALGYFYPVLMVIYSTIGVVVVFLTKRRTGQLWNTFMWGMLFAGWGVIVCLYGSEWYARVNCPGPKDPVENFFMPRSWSKSCHIIAL